MNRPFLAALAIALAVSMLTLCRAGATEAAWARLAGGGYTIVMTHALAPGIGDPPFFELGDCATQRNLSDRGRQQARRRGVRFAARAVSISKVFASEWCRTLETARNAFAIDVEPLAALNLAGEDEAAQTEAVVALVHGFRGPGNQVMVTHPENVAMLTGITPREGEVIIVAPARGGGIHTVARLLLD